jgi:DNA-binding response OmpR family regulator
MMGIMPDQDRILLIEDDEETGLLVAECLEEAGYQVICAADGVSGLKAFYQNQPDLVIIDAMVPEKDGWQVCQHIRAVSNIPLVFLSARAGEQDKIRALNLGADDYITKPFAPPELVARVWAAIRRYRVPAPDAENADYDDGVLMLEPSRYIARVRGKQVDLSATEFKVLAYFVQNAGTVLTPEQILEHLWGERYESFDSIKKYVSNLRKKIEDDPTRPDLIQTIRGVCYRYQRSFRRDTNSGSAS